MTINTNDYLGRAPTELEVQQIAEMFEDYQPGIIVIYDHYISDGPGYAGWLAVTVGGEPQFCDTIIKDKNGDMMLAVEEPSDRLEEPLPTLLRQAAKSSGSNDPSVCLSCIEEELTFEQYQIAHGFLSWCVEFDYTYGRNIQEVFKAYRTGDTRGLKTRTELDQRYKIPG